MPRKRFNIPTTCVMLLALGSTLVATINCFYGDYATGAFLYGLALFFGAAASVDS